jgi:lysozyme family protein
MGEQGISRRTLIINAAAFGVFSSAHFLRGGRTEDSELSPRDVGSRLALLESDAEANGLLVGHRGPTPQFTSANVYLESLPRIVRVVDEAGERKSPIANRAALLLSQVNAQEVVPAAFFEPTLKAAAPSFLSVRAQYQQMFKMMAVRPDYKPHVKWYADRLTANRARYAPVSAQTGVPWYVIGALHALEASFNFLAHLHNGDAPLDQTTRHVPTGRPNPWVSPYTWDRSAEDALQVEHFAGLTDWSIPQTLYRLEAYNGFGYRSEGVNSPYLWSFSDQYDHGKFVKDREWSPSAKSQQCGAAVMIHELVRRGLVSGVNG